MTSTLNPACGSPGTAARRRRPGVAAAYAAAVLAFTYAMLSVYWAAGGTALLSTVGAGVEDIARHGGLPAVRLGLSAAALKLVGGILALALVLPVGTCDALRVVAGLRDRGQRRAGVIDWSDAALTDPAGDFGLLYRDLGPAALTAALTSYQAGDTASLRERAAFYARCGLLGDLAYGNRTGINAYIDKASPLCIGCSPHSPVSRHT